MSSPQGSSNDEPASIRQDSGTSPRVTLVAEASTSTSSYPTSFYRNAQWTADGTSIIASTSDNKLCTYVLPEDLLGDNGRDPLPLQPQGLLQLPEPFYAAAPSPYFSLQDPSTHTVLLSPKDHPLQLHRLFPDHHPGTPSQICNYKLIRKETEEYITAESLLWAWPGTHFLVGSSNRLDYFDVTRTGSDGPTLTIATIPSKRHTLKGGGVGMKGMVSALSIQAPSSSATPLVAAGTWTRWLGLYDLARSNKPVSNWSVRGVVDATFDTPDDGGGVVQTIWSPCGRYLVINERRASSILVYDVRGTGQPINALAGRATDSQQRLTCDVFAGDESSGGGFEVWAGTGDGTVMVWEGVGSRPGLLDKSWSFAAHDSPVGASVLHPSGSVVATCSGAWTITSDAHVSSSSETHNGMASLGSSAASITKDCRVGVWAIGMGGQHQTEDV
jgi:telomerase Cajal body protein 1